MTNTETILEVLSGRCWNSRMDLTPFVPACSGQARWVREQSVDTKAPGAEAPEAPTSWSSLRAGPPRGAPGTRAALAAPTAGTGTRTPRTGTARWPARPGTGIG